MAAMPAERIAKHPVAANVRREERRAGRGVVMESSRAFGFQCSNSYVTGYFLRKRRKMVPPFYHILPFTDQWPFEDDVG
jgi:hypothetical protein